MLKNKLFSAFAMITASIAIFSSVKANAHERAGACGLTFNITSADVLIVSAGSGTGKITCTSLDGHVIAEAPVHIDIEGLGVGIGAYNMVGAIGNVGILDPRDIEGDYLVLDANAAVGLAAGANFGLKSQWSGVSMAGSVEGGLGLGAGAFGKVWHISLPNGCRYY